MSVGKGILLSSREIKILWAGQVALPTDNQWTFCVIEWYFGGKKATARPAYKERHVNVGLHRGKMAQDRSAWNSSARRVAASQ